MQTCRKYTLDVYLGINFYQQTFQVWFDYNIYAGYMPIIVAIRLNCCYWWTQVSWFLKYVTQWWQQREKKSFKTTDILTKCQSLVASSHSSFVAYQFCYPSRSFNLNWIKLFFFTTIMLFKYIEKDQSLLGYLSSYQQLTIMSDDFFKLVYLPYPTIAQIIE